MLGILVRGVAVGITETVPGISGSTVAMILGIYERLIYSLSILTTNKRKEALPFLFTFGVGMVIGSSSSILIINFLLSNYRAPTLMFFIGIIVGFLPYLWKETVDHSKNKLKVNHFIIMVLFFSIVVISQLLGDMNQLDVTNLSLADYLFFAAAGFIASTALVLPGISGALILIILGIYDIAVASLMSLDFPIILAICFGVVFGVLVTSKLVRYFLANHKVQTYAAMIGLVSGSIYAIFDNIDSRFSTLTIIMSSITFIGGMAFIMYLQQSQNRKI